MKYILALALVIVLSGCAPVRPQPRPIPLPANLPSSPSDQPANDNSQSNDYTTDNTPTSSANVNETTTVDCADDVYICPTGGYGTPETPVKVRRVPPSCDFAPCPG